VPLVVRTWNLFHGNAHPPQRRAFLEEMVRLVTADQPDVVCLQELPVWSFGHLGRWSGMQAVTGVGARPLLGSAELGRRVTDLHHGLLRSAVTGEGVGILVSRRHDVEPLELVRVAPRRVLVRARVGGLQVACFHVTGGAGADPQFRQLADHVEAAPVVVLAGDANLRPGEGATYDVLRERGFSEPLAGSIDQILVRGAPSTPPAVWPEDWRRVDGTLLSDHAPVQLSVG
jgi:endonuclease/exonuclease/phosphatase family metal-dependent hydrolase